MTLVRFQLLATAEGKGYACSETTNTSDNH